MKLGCLFSSLTILWEAAAFVYIIVYVCLATFNFKAAVRVVSCIVLCLNSWELSSDCLVPEEQPLLLSSNSVIEISDQVQTLPVGCDTSCCFCIFMSL